MAPIRRKRSAANKARRSSTSTKRGSRKVRGRARR